MSVIQMLAANPLLCASLAVTFGAMSIEAWRVRRALRSSEERA
jgi:hypothetical protein